MRTYGTYVLKRFAQFLLVVFVGISLTFFITHLTPIDPVEQMVASMTAFGDTSPEAVEMMREALRELYGVQGSLIEQYFDLLADGCWSWTSGRRSRPSRRRSRC